MDRKNIIIKKYFEKHSWIGTNIQSFNKFVDVELQKIVEGVGEITPTIIPEDMEEFKIKFGKIEVGVPLITEADGSLKKITPSEARIRKLTYASPITVEVSTYVDGVQKENYKTNIGKIPIMVKSKKCHLYGLGREELIKRNEDPDDTGGYFIINGNERVLITVEDLASNRLFVQKNKTGPSKYTGRIFSESGSYRIPHTIEQMKDGIFYITFTRFKRIPIMLVIKALGLTNDKEITQAVTPEGENLDDLYINFYDLMDIKKHEDALDILAARLNLSPIKEIRLERLFENLDRFLLPHLGNKAEDRVIKAYNLCKAIRKLLAVSKKGKPVTDKDHYGNKRLKLSGDLLSDLFKTNIRSLVNDILYNFQRLVKRGKFTSTKIIIREKLLSSRIQSAIATGVWPGGRKGISQNIDRVNFLAFQSHLQRVVSLLSSSQENFEARAIHSTHWGRLCPIETPEGTNIGLRKNLSMLGTVSQKIDGEEKILKNLEKIGLQTKW